MGESDGPFRRIVCVGQFGRTLSALVNAGAAGVTALEVSDWALRLAHYVFVLRTRYGLDIETVREAHEGPAGPGHHGRYFLRSPIRILRTSDSLDAA